MADKSGKALQKAQRVEKHRWQQLEDALADSLSATTGQVVPKGNSALAEVLQQRYSIPPLVVAALKESGKIAAFRLLETLNSERFSELPVATQMRVIELALDKAYGKSEGSGAFLAAQARNPEAANSQNLTLGKQLDRIEGWTPPELAAAREGGSRPVKPGSVGSGRVPPEGGDGVSSPVSPSPPSNVVPLKPDEVPRYFVDGTQDVDQPEQDAG